MKDSTAGLHNVILKFLLNYKKKEQRSLTFYLRKSNKKDRQKVGYLFHGNDKYISIPFYKQSGGTNRTQSIGFNFWLKSKDEPHLEIVHNASTSPTHRSLYEGIIEDLKKKKWREVKRLKTKTQFLYPKQMWSTNLTMFLEEHKPIIDRRIKIHGMANDFFVEESNLLSELEEIGIGIN